MTSNAIDTKLERAVLGALLLEADYLPEVMSIITDPEAFTDPLHRAMFEQIQLRHQAGESIDLYALCSSPKLRESRAQIVNITTEVGSGIGCVGHSRLLMELLIRRRLHLFATQLLSRAEGDVDVGDLLSWSQGQVDQMTGAIGDDGSLRSSAEVMSETIAHIEQRAKAYAQGEPIEMSTGLSDLDRVTGGWRGGQLIVVAGRPSMGKSAVMMHFARAVCEQGRSVVLFSLEMSGQELGDRLLLGDTAIDSNRYKVGNLSADDWGSIERANSNLCSMRLTVCDSSMVSMARIRAVCTQLRAKGRCDMIVIDYLQLLDMPSRNRSAIREQLVAETTRVAKNLAKELNVPIILLSQLSRKVEDRANKAPMLQDLRESGAIEQDANIVMFIHRPERYAEPTIETSRYGAIDSHGVGVLTVAKNRNGEIGTIYFSHSPDLNRITDYRA